MLHRIESVFVSMNRAFVAAVLFIVFAIVSANVVGRYGFNTSLSWAEEAARHLMVLGAFCGAGLALREGRLVAITTLVDAFSTRWGKATRILTLLMMAVLMIVLTWLGIEFVRFGWNKETMATGISRGIPYLAIPVGCVLFLIHLAFFARRYLTGTFEQGAGEAPDADAAPQGRV